MITTLAIANYRSFLNFVAPVSNLTIITGANGTGKSNLYRALRLLADTAQGNVIESLAGEGGLQKAFWAGPEKLSRAMRQGEVPVQGGPRQSLKRLKLGFASTELSYSIELGLPTPSRSVFSLDPEIKSEMIFTGPIARRSSVLVDRNSSVIKIRDGRKWKITHQHVSHFDSVFGQGVGDEQAPEITQLRETIRGWRFYDHFRSDRDAPTRQNLIGTRSPVLASDGHNFAAAIQTIREIGDAAALDEAIADAFDGASLSIDASPECRLSLQLHQPGLLRPVDAHELSDGTLRYLLLVAALLTPRPPPLMVLNEPETSLHPDLLAPLARLIHAASQKTQLWVITHAHRLVNALEALEEEGANEGDLDEPRLTTLALEKELGSTRVNGLGMLDEPPWQWR